MQGQIQTSEGQSQDPESEPIGVSHDRRILDCIRQIIRAADIDSHRLAAVHHITAPQLVSLMAIVEGGSVTSVDIARRVHLSPSTIVGVLDRLESKGLIQRERDVEDRRLVHITPTREGRLLASKTPFPLQFSLERALRQLSEREREDIAQTMERLVKLMGATEIDNGPMLEIVGIGKEIGSPSEPKT